MGSKGKDEPIRKFEDNFTKWCFIYFNRFGSQHQKNVHDCFNAFYPRFEISKNSQNPEYKLGYLSEVRIEPFQTVDHHQKNLYEKRFCNPADFNLQYKHFDDLDRCRKIGHVTCTGNVCGRSFARAANQPFSSRFRFSVLIERQRKMAPSPMAPNYSSPQKPKFDRFDYHVVLNNTGDEPIWFNCLLFDICESKYFGLTNEVFAFRFFHYMRIQIDLTFIIRYNLGFFHNFKLKVLLNQPAISFDEIEKISKNVYHAVAPKTKKTAISVNKRFCDLVKQLNSKQLRLIKERLFTINIVLDWDGISSQDNQPVVQKWERKDDTKRLAQLKSKKITGGLVIRPYFWLFIRSLFFRGGPKWLVIRSRFFSRFPSSCL